MKDSANGPDKRVFRIWTDPESEDVILEANQSAMAFRNMDQIRWYAVSILNTVNRIEILTQPKIKTGSKRKFIGKGYAKKVISEIEEMLNENHSETTIEDRNDTSGEEEE